MTGILAILNVTLPQMIALYKRVRSEAGALDAGAQVLTDADLIELLRTEADETVAKADEILHRLRGV